MALPQEQYPNQNYDKPPAYNPATLQQQQAYWAQQVPVGYAQPQPQIIIVQQAVPTIHYAHVHAPKVDEWGPKPPACAVFKHRVKSGHGAVRAALFILGLIHLGLVAGTIGSCYDGTRYIGLLVMPLKTLIQSFLVLCAWKCRPKGKSCLGVFQILSGLLYIGQASAFATLWHSFWDIPFSPDEPDFANWCNVPIGLMVCDTLSAVVIAVLYFAIGLSRICCHCLTDITPPKRAHAASANNCEVANPTQPVVGEPTNNYGATHHA